MKGRFPIWLTGVLLPLGFLPFFASCASPGRFFYSKDIAYEYYAIAEGYAGLAKHEQALHYYREASREPSLKNASLYGMGKMHALSGNWNEAVSVFESLYEKDGKNALIASAYAYALAQSGKNDEAVAVYFSVYDANKMDPEAGRNYAEILFIAKRYADLTLLIPVLREAFPAHEIIPALEALETKLKEATAPPVQEEEEPVDQ